ncbi:MAG: ribose-phosphate pyrophosphokinase [Pseudomonadota bacterium]
MVDYDELEALLMRAACARRSLTYGDVLAYFERRVTPIMVSALCKDLGVVCDRLQARGAPELACLVVRKSDHLPGEGYFKSCRREGDYDGPSEGPLAEAFLARRQEQAFVWASAHAA